MCQWQRFSRGWPYLLDIWPCKTGHRLSNLTLSQRLLEKLFQLSYYFLRRNTLHNHFSPKSLPPHIQFLYIVHRKTKVKKASIVFSPYTGSSTCIATLQNTVTFIFPVSENYSSTVVLAKILVSFSTSTNYYTMTQYSHSLVNFSYVLYAAFLFL